MDIIELHEKATAGDAEAKFELSLAYYDGDGVEKDEEKALTLLTEAARTEYLPAMRSYANRLLDGVGAPQDKQAGMAMLMKAAEAGHAGAQGDLGLCYLNGDDGVEFDYEKALFWLERSARQGDVESQGQLGEAYCNPPEDIEPDYEKSFHWNSEAAEKGSVLARENLAVAYADGKGTAADPQKAFEMFTALADDGSKFGMRWLGICYLNGKGTQEDQELARKWFSLGAEAGDEYSMRMLGLFCFDEWHETHSDESFAQMEKWLSAAIEAGEYGACCALGEAYNERGKAGDADKAEALFRRGAEDGYTRPAYRLARMLLLGDGKPPEGDPEGRKWLEFAAENGDADAMHLLSVCYDNGSYGFPKDSAQSFQWLKANCENEEDTTAWFVLATAYKKGDGTKKDDEQAFLWYKKAADAGLKDACSQLAELYARGAGTPPDMEQARAYLTRLRELGGDEETLHQLEVLLPKFEKEGIAIRAAANPDDMDLQSEYAKGCLSKDPDKAVKLLEGLGEKGHQDTLAFLHLIFSKGLPDDGSLIPADQSRANYWLEKAASWEGKWAYERLSSNYASGADGYPHDEAKAFYWMERRLQQDPNDPGAQVLVGIHYLDGTGVARDMERGIELVRKSAQAGLGYGQYIYGRLYHLGGGSIQRDLRQAEHWMGEAVKNGWEDAGKELEEVRRELAAQCGGNRTRNFCSQCGAALPQGAGFCAKCGTKIGAAPADEKENYGNGKAKRNGIIPLISCVLVFFATIYFTDVMQRLMIFASVPVFIWTLVVKIARPVGTKKLFVGLALSGLAAIMSLIGILTF